MSVLHACVSQGDQTMFDTCLNRILQVARDDQLRLSDVKQKHLRWPFSWELSPDDADPNEVIPYDPAVWDQKKWLSTVLNQDDREHRTPLFLCAMLVPAVSSAVLGQMAQALLATGAVDVECAVSWSEFDFDETTALMAAARCGNAGMVPVSLRSSYMRMNALHLVASVFACAVIS